MEAPIVTGVADGHGHDNTLHCPTDIFDIGSTMIWVNATDVEWHYDALMS
jgi:hypothetical protein